MTVKSSFFEKQRKLVDVASKYSHDGVVDNTEYTFGMPEMWNSYRHMREPVIDYPRPSGCQLIYSRARTVVMITNEVAMWDINFGDRQCRYSIKNNICKIAEKECLRVYDKHGGIRVLANSYVDSASKRYMDLFVRLGASGEYYVISQVQGCFRIRITPQPWIRGDEDRAVCRAIYAPKSSNPVIEFHDEITGTNLPFCFLA